MDLKAYIYDKCGPIAEVDMCLNESIWGMQGTGGAIIQLPRYVYVGGKCREQNPILKEQIVVNSTQIRLMIGDCVYFDGFLRKLKITENQIEMQIMSPYDFLQGKLNINENCNSILSFTGTYGEAINAIWQNMSASGIELEGWENVTENFDYEISETTSFATLMDEINSLGYEWIFQDGKIIIGNKELENKGSKNFKYNHKSEASNNMCKIKEICFDGALYQNQAVSIQEEGGVKEIGCSNAEISDCVQRFGVVKDYKEDLQEKTDEFVNNPQQKDRSYVILVPPCSLSVGDYVNIEQIDCDDFLSFNDENARVVSIRTYVNSGNIFQEATISYNTNTSYLRNVILDSARRNRELA